MRKFFVTIIIPALCLLLGSCAKGGTNITAVSISPSQDKTITVSEGKVITGICFDAVCDGKLNDDDITFVSTDSQVAEVSPDISADNYGGKAYCKLKAQKPGQAFIYAKAAVGNAVSERISVTVTPAVSKITVAEKNISLTIGEPYTGSFAAYTLSGDRASDEKFNFVGYDTDIIDIKSDGKGRFEIIPAEVGSTSFRIETSDGLISSDDISVTVSEETTEVGNLTTEVDENAAPNAAAISGDIVYVTKSGKKYHLSQSCGGANSTAVSLEEAEQSGYEPCKRCAQ